MKILVTGATGNVSGEVVRNLHKRGVEIRALVRKPEAANFPSGVEVVAGDQTDPDSIREAIGGVDKLFLSAIDSRDLAAAAAVTLTEDGHEGQTYDLVSSCQITGPGNAALWSRALGKEVFYTGHDFDAWEKQMSTQLPGWMAYDMRTMLEGYVERGFASTEADVSRVTKLLGYAPRTYEAFVQEATTQWSKDEQR